MKRKMYSPPKDRLGIRSFIARTVAMKPKKMFLGQTAFKLLILTAPLGKIPILGWLYKKVILMSGTDYSQGYSIPLDIAIEDADKQVVLPITLMTKAVKDASYRAIMHSCICRDAQGCTDYPRDTGCIFLGEAAKKCVDNGIAREATAEECYTHIDNAAKVGLSGQALWVEVEKYIWGFETNDADKFMEFCFCCPCCCTGFKFAEKTDRASRLLFHRSSGWQAKVNVRDCVDCRACYDICPRHAIDIKNGYVQTNEDCGGCGLCIPKCNTNAISIVQTKEMKNDIKDYFEDINFKV